MDGVKDIVPQLLEDIQKSYEDNVNKNILLQKMIRNIEDGKGDGVTLLKAANEHGTALGEAFKKHVSEEILPDGKMYYNIAQRLIEPLLKKNYDNIASLCEKVQTKLNKQNNINLKAVKPSYKKEKTDSLVDYISSADHYSQREKSFIDAIESNSRSIVDDSVRENCEFQAECGMSPVIERYAVGKTCEWCANLAGTYHYPDEVPKEVYQRHANCNCIVIYKLDKHVKDFQDVWSKKWNDEKILRRVEKTQHLTNQKIEMFRKKRDNIIRSDYLARRKTAGDGHEIIDKPTYNKLTRRFEKRGGIIIRGEEAARHLKTQNAYASYMMGSGIAFIRDDATISDVLEEMFHAEQDWKNAFGQYDLYERLLLREIQAQEYLLSCSKKYKIPKSEIETTRKNLEFYQKKLKDFKKSKRSK